MKYTITTGTITVIRILSVKEGNTLTGKSRKSKDLLCRCFCGKEFVALKHNYPNGVKSCGCLRKGQSKAPLYDTFKSLYTRCYNKNSKDYKEYGGRGITICDRWLNRENGFWYFKQDMGEKPGKGYTVDRKNVNGPYSPENCRWATQKEQCNNKRNNVTYTYKGVKQTVTELAETYSIDRYNLYCRLEDGWTIEKAIETPVKTYKKRITKK